MSAITFSTSTAGDFIHKVHKTVPIELPSHFLFISTASKESAGRLLSQLSCALDTDTFNGSVSLPASYD